MPLNLLRFRNHSE